MKFDTAVVLGDDYILQKTTFFINFIVRETHQALRYYSILYILRK